MKKRSTTVARCLFVDFSLGALSCACALQLIALRTRSLDSPHTTTYVSSQKLRSVIRNFECFYIKLTSIVRNLLDKFQETYLCFPVCMCFFCFPNCTTVTHANCVGSRGCPKVNEQIKDKKCWSFSNMLSKP